MRSIHAICTILCVTVGLLLSDSGVTANNSDKPSVSTPNPVTNISQNVEKIDTTTAAPTSFTTKPTISTTFTTPTTLPTTPSTTLSTAKPTSTTQTTTASSTTSVPPIITTKTTPTTTTAATTTASTISSTTAVKTTAVPPSSKDRHFDGLSFFGGIVLATCLMAIAVFAWKFYRQCNEGNYRTL